jgi:hypothetical protein
VTPPPRRHRRNRKRSPRRRTLRVVILLCAGAASAIGTAWLINRVEWSGLVASNPWPKTRHALEARGEPLSLKDLAPPPLDDPQNFFADPAFEELADLAPVTTGQPPEPKLPLGKRRLDAFQTATGLPPAPSVFSGMTRASVDRRTLTDLAHAAAFFRKQGRLPRNKDLLAAADQVLGALAPAAPAAAALRGLAERPDARFPLDYRFLPQPPTPHLFHLLRGAEFLQLRAAAHMAAADGQAAADDIFLIIRMADALVTEPTLPSQAARRHLLESAADSIWEGIERQAFDDVQLAALESALRRCRLLVDLGLALRGERAAFNDSVERSASITASDARRQSLLAPWLDHWDLPPPALRARQTAFNLAIQNLLDRIDHAATAGFDPSAFSPDLWPAENPPDPVTREVFEKQLELIKRFAIAQSRVQQARIACALARYRLRRGGYPAVLDDLLPELLDSIPLDPFTGAPCRYQRLDSDDFLIESEAPWRKSASS